MVEEHSRGAEDALQSEATSDGAAAKADNLSVTAAEGQQLVRVVAIGASAGGLEPLEQFIEAMPAETGLAFVVIQHLSPDFRSMMDELLTRHSSMEIHRVEDGMVIEPNAIYLNLPQQEMTVRDGLIVLQKRNEERGLNLPIDSFFESLASDAGLDSIGVVLSGTGSDGTKGSRAIRDAGGAVFVQEPRSAKFDGMPNSVLNQQLADVVAPPKQLAELVLRHVRGQEFSDEPDLPAEPMEPLESILFLVREKFGTDFHYYKKSTIERRIQRRSELSGYGDLATYLGMLRNDEDELEALYSDMLIEVTSFFRDDKAFEMLQQKVIPSIAAEMSRERQIRVWVPGCASGEEAYSIAILFAEYAHANDVPLNLKILATDIHSRSLSIASAGTFSEQALLRLTSAQIERYFEKQGNYMQIRADLRRMIVFSPHNILKDPPFTRLDLVSCRNVLIYFNDVAQHKALALFHFGLQRGGYLFLGPSETVGKLSTEFKTIDQRWRAFQKSRNVRLMEATSVLPRGGEQQPFRARERDDEPSEVSSLVRQPVSLEPKRAFNNALQSLLTRYAPPGFLLTRDGDLVHVFGDAGSYIRVAEGGFSKRIVDLIHADLRLPVGAALERAKGRTASSFRRRALISNSDGTATSVTVCLERLSEGGGDSAYLLLTVEADSQPSEPREYSDVESIEAADAAGLLQDRIVELESDLRATEESLQTTIEELETSNEELQATNEELMASNEELQSTNEELHSVNEELYTVSAEHQRKIEELTEATNDMDHLLKSTDIGTIFLDSNLRIRRFTPSANKAFNLIAQDVGRPISHVTYRFEGAEFLNLVDEVLDGGAVREREVNVDGRAHLLRILPYVPSPDEPRGVVITILDVTALKQAEQRIEDLSELHRDVLEDVADFIVRWRAEDGVVTYCNEVYGRLEGRKPEDMVGQRIDDIIPNEQHDEFFGPIRALRPGDYAHGLVERVNAEGQRYWRAGHTRAIADANGNVEFYQSTGRDATAEVSYLRALEALLEATNSEAEDDIDRIRKLLMIARDYLGVQQFVSVDCTTDGLVVDVTCGGQDSLLEAGQTLPLGQLFMTADFGQSGVLAIQDVGSSDYARDAAHRELGVNCFIGARLRSKEGRPGLLCGIAADGARAKAFSETEIGFMLLLVRWVDELIERSRRLNAMRQSESELRLIFDAVPSRIVYKDAANNLLRVNRTAAEYFGRDPSTIIGTSLDDIYDLSIAARILEEDEAAIESKSISRSVMRGFGLDGAEHGWVQRIKVPHWDPITGEPRVLVVSTDITEEKENEERLRRLNVEFERSNSELQNANEGLASFAFVASHDLQEPLRKITQFGDLLLQEYDEKLEGDGKYYVNVMSNSAYRMSRLIRGLLDYSTASNHEIELEDVRLTGLFAEIIDDQEVMIEDANGVVEVGDLPIVSADRSMIERLFGNILSNGLKYHHSDRPPVVNISSAEVGDAYEISISDNGVGFDNRQRDKIFEPFARLHRRSDFDGSGIGLAICRSVCDRHGWSMRATSEIGEGSTFIVRIPKGSTQAR